MFSLVKITANLVQRHVVGSCRPYQNLGQIDHNLHNHVFDDIISKPPIDQSAMTSVEIKCQFINLLLLALSSHLIALEYDFC